MGRGLVMPGDSEETQGNGNQINEQPVQVSHFWLPPECILNGWNNCKAQTIHIILCVCCCFASHIKLICLFVICLFVYSV